MDEQVMRVPPNNADAEKSVLGCMMQDREALSLAFELLTAEDFYQPANREIFDAMRQLSQQGMPIAPSACPPRSTHARICRSSTKNPPCAG